MFSAPLNAVRMKALYFCESHKKRLFKRILYEQLEQSEYGTEYASHLLRKVRLQRSWILDWVQSKSLDIANIEKTSALRYEKEYRAKGAFDSKTKYCDRKRKNSWTTDRIIVWSVTGHQRMGKLHLNILSYIWISRESRYHRVIFVAAL